MKVKTKIIYFITKSVWGGAAKYVLDLAAGLDGTTFDVAIAAGGAGPLQKRAEAAAIRWIAVPHFGRNIKLFSDVASFFEVYRILQREKPDTIHVNSSKAGGICGLAGFLYNLTHQAKIKMIFTAHGWAFAEERGALSLFLIRTLSKMSSFFYDTIIVISKFDFDKDIATPEKTVLIHNGLAANTFDFFPKKEAQIKIAGKELPLVIGTIGEWTRNKGWNVLLEAASLLFQKFPELAFIMIGGGENPDKEKVLKTILEKGIQDKVITIEFLENAARYLRAFDIFVFPSRKEGLPYALLEAGLAGLPIVASAVGGNLDIIENGKTGILVPKNNAAKLSEAMKKLIPNQELQKTLGENAKEKVEKEFSLSKMREETYALYR